MSRLPSFAGVPFEPAGSPEPAGERAPWETPEGVTVAPAYGPADLDGLDFLDGRPGIAPYLRGPYPTMYVTNPWTIRQYAGFSTAEDSNAFYRRNLAAGRCPGSPGASAKSMPPASRMNRMSPCQTCSRKPKWRA